jgi:hypothetical protein
MKGGNRMMTIRVKNYPNSNRLTTGKFLVPSAANRKSIYHERDAI